MRGADKPGFKCRWRQINALLEHTVKKPLEAFDIALAHMFETTDLWLIGKKQAKHRADSIGLHRNTGILRLGQNSIHEVFSFRT